MVTLCDALLEPTVWLPKLTDVGLTLMFACATVPKANNIVMPAATARIFPLIFQIIFIFFIIDPLNSAQIS